MRAALVASFFLAALAPTFSSPPHRASASVEFSGWPAAFEGKPLEPIPLSDRELGFLEAFPGRIARFQCEGREVVLRWVAQPTRKLHPASDCLRGSGYTIGAQRLFEDESGLAWSRFDASRGEEHLTITERVVDEHGGSWPDPSAWFWSAMTGATTGPWWATTVAERRQGVEGPGGP